MIKMLENLIICNIDEAVTKSHTNDFILFNVFQSNIDRRRIRKDDRREMSRFE